MKKIFIVITILFLVAVFILPVPASASATTNAGVKPGSFWYGFDIAFEKINLFFTFSPEKKVQKALAYADERLAEIEAVAEEKNPDAVKTAIVNYESNIALATEKSKEVKDKGQAETLLNSIADNNSKNQEVLAAILIKVPEEARAAITQAIEASKKGQEEATKQIAELKGEVEKLKNEVAELKKEPNNSQANEVEKLKKELEALKKQSVVQSAPKQPTPTTQNSQEQKKAEEKPKTITLPNGAIVEMDANGNIIRTIKEAPQQTYIAPVPTTQNQTSVTVQISSVNITTTITSAKIEWQTDKPTESKIFLSGGGISSKVYNSESGLSTRHSVSVSGLKGDTNYSYEIEAIAGGNSYKKTGNFSTQSPPPPTTSLLLPKRLNYGGQASWPNGNNYGNVNDTCNNCVVLITEMPTTANVSLMEYTALRGGAALDGFAANNPQSISIYADNNLSTTHVFLFSHMGMDQTKKYSFIVSATDQSGNKYIQQFGGVDSSSNYLPGPFKWGENQTVSWVSDYQSQYMKSNYYVDVPLTKVQ